MKIKAANIEVSTACNAHCALCVRNRYMKLPSLMLDFDKLKSLDWDNADIEQIPGPGKCHI